MTWVNAGSLKMDTLKQMKETPGKLALMKSGYILKSCGNLQT